MNEYLIAANSKRGQLIFNIFRPIDLGIAAAGATITFFLFLLVKPSSLLPGIIVLLPVLVCGFLVMPIPNYHNVLCVLQNIYKFYCVDKNDLRWKGWCAKDEFK